jgi:hypothetical protein
MNRILTMNRILAATVLALALGAALHPVPSYAGARAESLRAIADQAREAADAADEAADEAEAAADEAEADDE